MQDERNDEVRPPNRRCFLTGCLGIGAGMAAPSASPAMSTPELQARVESPGPSAQIRGDGLLRWPLDRMEVLGIPRDWSAVGLGLHPFSPERVLVLPSGERLRDASRCSGRSRERLIERFERECAERHYKPEPMTREKLDAIIWIMDGMTRHYNRPDLFEDWALGLIGRESLGSTGIGNYFGLAHQFQYRGEVEVDCPPVDWWLILCPDGVDWESLEDEPVHILFAHVLGRPWRPGHPHSLLDVWCLSSRIVWEIDDSRAISRMGRLAAARSLNPIAARSLEQMEL